MKTVKLGEQAVYLFLLFFVFPVNKKVVFRHLNVSMLLIDHILLWHFEASVNVVFNASETIFVVD